MIRKLEGRYVESRIDGEAVLVQLDNGTFHALKGSGLAIWDLIDGTRDGAAIVTALMGIFDVSRERCETDVDRFLRRMAEAGFVALR